eukprot:6498371-Prymnesium_polylepis.1
MKRKRAAQAADAHQDLEERYAAVHPAPATSTEPVAPDAAEVPVCNNGPEDSQGEVNTGKSECEVPAFTAIGAAPRAQPCQSPRIGALASPVRHFWRARWQ